MDIFENSTWLKYRNCDPERDIDIAIGFSQGLTRKQLSEKYGMSIGEIKRREGKIFRKIASSTIKIENQKLHGTLLKEYYSKIYDKTYLDLLVKYKIYVNHKLSLGQLYRPFKKDIPRNISIMKDTKMIKCDKCGKYSKIIVKESN